jgi:hydrogenase maturation factor
VPLLFQQSACSSFKSVVETNWRNYDLQQPRSSVPIGPLVIMIHMASVWVPFTSESKEAIADYDEIRKEMKLALMECGRKLGTYLRKRAKMRREGERRDVFERYIGEIAKAISEINGTDAKKLYETLQEQARKRTAVADLELDDEGRAIKHKAQEESDEDGVIIVESAQMPVIAAPTHSPVEAQATLMEVAPVKRAGAKGGKAAKAEKPAKGAKAAASGKSEKPTKVEAKAEAKGGGDAKAVASQPVKAAKPKMRLNPKTGKLEPVDEGPSLF